ncbi:hypothetical protein Nepgr_019488 [Nepenthes gracilis]|uniref:Protein FAR1-RELATED SEQUENCE n=1 Tax=Nepenthes gracilis TaxID=150966 RepID=A0AAD3SV49_NEPGR|nr:hypothetical protein Nepgr_019488 [Nepenthes gracilis]
MKCIPNHGWIISRSATPLHIISECFEIFSFMGESSPNVEEILEDEGDELEDEREQLFEFKGDGHDDGSEQMLEIEGNDVENGRQQHYEIVGNIYEIDNEKLFEIECNDHENESEQVLEIEAQDHKNCGHDAMVAKGKNHENSFVQMLEIEDSDHESNQLHTTRSVQDQCSISHDNCYPAPVVGMEFDSYDDAYNYYNSYAKELGFAIRVKSSWTKRNSKEKRGAVLCCNCEGFKTAKDASNRRKETRTGCLSMIRLRLVESNRWRVDEVKLEHNHLFDPERAQNSKSHKKIEAGAKRKLEPSIDVEVRTIKLYRMPAADAAAGSGSFNLKGKENGNHVQATHLKLKDGDTQAIHSFFCRGQLTAPNFLYLMDLNDEGQLRNVFWIDSRSRAAYSYFGDVVAVDTTCLSNKYEIPVLAFVGLNHHGQSILLGCGLLADESIETYIWIFRAWLTCMLGRSPQTIVTGQSKTMQSAIAEVFSRANHCLYLPLVVQNILHNLGHLQDYEALHSVLNRTIYGPSKVDEFEIAWENMIQHFGIKDHGWLQTLYEDRERWAPVYLKEMFLAGFFGSQASEPVIPIFDGFIHEKTSLKEFLDVYDLVREKKRHEESLLDSESRVSIPLLRTRCTYGLQLSKLYTKQIFDKFQVELEKMSSCLSISDAHVNGTTVTYMIRERDVGTITEFRNFEVIYDKPTLQVRCLCGCFYLNGYICRHALCVLDLNGVEEIPFHYILPRFRKDIKRVYVLDFGSNSVDTLNPVQWYDHLYRRAMLVVGEGMASQDRYMVAWQAFKEALNKVRLTSGKKQQS